MMKTENEYDEDDDDAEWASGCVRWERYDYDVGNQRVRKEEKEIRWETYTRNEDFQWKREEWERERELLWEINNGQWQWK